MQTRCYGYVRSDHILFIAAGAFHVSCPRISSPELQGRFPIRVELQPLTEQDFIRIMTEPENALTGAVPGAGGGGRGGARVHPSRGSPRSPAWPYMANDRMENIGARRLHTVMSALLEGGALRASRLRHQTDRLRRRRRAGTALQDRGRRRLAPSSSNPLRPSVAMLHRRIGVTTYLFAYAPRSDGRQARRVVTSSARRCRCAGRPSGVAVTSVLAVTIGFASPPLRRSPGRRLRPRTLSPWSRSSTTLPIRHMTT